MKDWQVSPNDESMIIEDLSKGISSKKICSIHDINTLRGKKTLEMFLALPMLIKLSNEIFSQLDESIVSQLDQSEEVMKVKDLLQLFHLTQEPTSAVNSVMKDMLNYLKVQVKVTRLALTSRWPNAVVKAELESWIKLSVEQKVVGKLVTEVTYFTLTKSGKRVIEPAIKPVQSDSKINKVMTSKLMNSDDSSS